MTTIHKQRANIRLAGSLVALAAIAAVGLALRLWRLGEQSFWYDEAQTLFVARFPYAEIVQRAYRPPLYHFLLHIWSALVPGSEFALRLPSALFGAAVPLLTYLVAARLYSRRAGLVAAALAAISPTLVFYSQELRMYSLMALEFLLLLYLCSRLMLDRPRSGLALWLALWLAEVASLYTHYFAIPFLGWLILVAAAVLALGRRWRTLAAWLAVQVTAAIAFIPWLLLIRSGRGGTEDYLAAEPLPVMTSVPGVKVALVQSWHFYTSGTMAPPGGLAISLSLVAAVALALAVLALLAGVVAAARRRALSTPGPLGASPASDAVLLALVGGPFLTALAMYQFRPGVVHPRHMMMIAGPLLILVARTADLAAAAFPSRRARPGAWTLAVVGHAAGLVALLAFAGLFLLGLRVASLDPDYQRPDVRSLARRIEKLTAPGDVVLMPYTDYAFDYYFHGPAQTYRLETRVGDAALAGWLLPRMQGARRAVLLHWVHAFADGRDFLPWLLQANGQLRERDWDAERWLSVYDLDSPLALPALAPTSVRMDPLLLQGVYLPPAVVADQPLAVALLWSAAGPPPADYKASVRVQDPSGHVIAADDRVLLGEKSLAPSSRWPAGASERNYYLPALPTGTPPLTYTVSVSVYHGQKELDILNPAGAAMGTSYTLGSVRVRPPESFPAAYPASLPMVKVEREVAPGLVLEGFTLDRPSLQPGESLWVTLYWKATAAPLPAYEPELRVLSAQGTPVGSQQGHPAYGQYPCDRWRAGELVVDRRAVPVDPEAGPGEARLELAVAGHEPLALGPVTLEQADRQYTLPPMQYTIDVAFGNVARLRGFALEKQTVKLGEPVRLTLYWQAINEGAVPVGYAVFTHLLDPQNQVIAQHDGQPAGGGWPTTTWVKGQVVVDPHDLTFREGVAYEGEALLEVGLYNPQGFQRLATPGGEDRVVLPVKVNVTK